MTLALSDDCHIVCLLIEEISKRKQLYCVNILDKITKNYILMKFFCVSLSSCILTTNGVSKMATSSSKRSRRARNTLPNEAEMQELILESGSERFCSKWLKMKLRDLQSFCKSQSFWFANLLEAPNKTWWQVVWWICIWNKSRRRRNTLRSYWSGRISTKVPSFGTATSFERFEKIPSNLHFAENLLLDKSRKLFKIRPINSRYIDPMRSCPIQQIKKGKIWHKNSQKLRI